MSNPTEDGPKDACKTYVEQTKLLVTLASAFIVAPAALIPLISGDKRALISERVLSYFTYAEIGFLFSVLMGYVVVGTIAGSQNKNEYDVYRTATIVTSLAQIGAFIAGLVYIVAVLLNFFAAPAPFPPNPLEPPPDVIIFPAPPALPPFESGSTRASEDLKRAICEVRRALQDGKSKTAVVVGHHDVRELSGKTRAVAETNAGLAQLRAEQVSNLLGDTKLCGASSTAIIHTLVLIGGPRNIDLAKYKTIAERELALAEDRRTLVYGIRNERTLGMINNIGR